MLAYRKLNGAGAIVNPLLWLKGRASLVCTLPREMAPDNTAAVNAWVSVTLGWLRKQRTGQLAYVVLHQDESRPHIHSGGDPYERSGTLLLQGVLQ